MTALKTRWVNVSKGVVGTGWLNHPVLSQPYPGGEGQGQKTLTFVCWLSVHLALYASPTAIYLIFQPEKNVIAPSFYFLFFLGKCNAIEDKPKQTYSQPGIFKQRVNSVTYAKR